jgi:hypothetical protein
MLKMYFLHVQGELSRRYKVKFDKRKSPVCSRWTSPCSKLILTKNKFPTCFLNFLEVNLWCSLSELLSAVFSWWGFPTVNIANNFCETSSWQIELANKIEVNYSFSSISVYHQWYFFTHFFVNFQVHRNWTALQKKMNSLNWVNFIDRS